MGCASSQEIDLARSCLNGGTHKFISELEGFAERVKRWPYYLAVHTGTDDIVDNEDSEDLEVLKGYRLTRSGVPRIRLGQPGWTSDVVEGIAGRCYRHSADNIDECRTCIKSPVAGLCVASKTWTRRR
jgi:hypothetical protein